MRFIKRHLCMLPICYAVELIPTTYGPRYVFATDDTGPCVAIDPSSGDMEQVWDGPGGTMSIIPIPGSPNEFLASQNFMPGFSALHARIVRVKRDDEGWHVSPWMDLPYVHRFDLIKSGGDIWFMGCILSSTDKESADWDYPGSIVVAKLTQNCDPPAKLHTIAAGMTQNHGYCRKVDSNGQEWFLTTCREGVYRVYPSQDGRLEAWRVEKLIDVPASDAAICDLDGDGEQEIAVISPFHGDKLYVYHKEDQRYVMMGEVHHNSGFLHAIWGGKLGGRETVLCGGRSQAKEFFYIDIENGKLVPKMIETGYGPSNLTVIDTPEGQLMLVANRQAGECAQFTVIAE